MVVMAAVEPARNTVMIPLFKLLSVTNSETLSVLSITSFSPRDDNDIVFETIFIRLFNNRLHSNSFFRVERLRLVNFYFCNRSKAGLSRTSSQKRIANVNQRYNAASSVNSHIVVVTELATSAISS